MAKLLALYAQPANADAFDSYYAHTHLPLAHKIPRLRSLLVSAAPPKALAGTAPYLVAELTFDSMADLEAALGSPEGQATASDLANFAQAGVTLLAYDTRSSG